jgi:hypothetical protein
MNFGQLDLRIAGEVGAVYPERRDAALGQTAAAVHDLDNSRPSVPQRLIGSRLAESGNRQRFPYMLECDLARMNDTNRSWQRCHLFSPVKSASQ